MSSAKKQLISKASKLASNNNEKNAVPADFVSAFFESVPEEDMIKKDAKTLVAITNSLWNLSLKRKNNTPIIRVFTPNEKTDGWRLPRTVIEIVYDNMPFLVDSIAAEITRHKLIIRRLLHPFFYVERDKKGLRKDFQTTQDETHTQESYIHIQLEGQIPQKLQESLAESLEKVLYDVLFATQDWRAMLDQMANIIQDMEQSPSKSVKKEEIAEARDFLRYLYNNNFTLLGYREYKFIRKGRKKELASETVKGSSLGLLSDDKRPVYLTEGADYGLPADIQQLRKDSGILTISKVNKNSTVHRRVPMDAIAIKTYDSKGKVTGERLFIGLFTSVTYSRSVEDVPYLRRKVKKVIEASKFDANSHNGKALKHILEKYPRDELFQIPEKRLLDVAHGILRLQERQRVALFTREDPFNRFISCLVYIPRDRYETNLRITTQKILERDLNGKCRTFHTTLDDSPLARVLFIIDIDPNAPPKVNRKALEKKLIEASQPWSIKIRHALINFFQDEKPDTNLNAIELSHKYAEAFPSNYIERGIPKETVLDILKMEESYTTDRVTLSLYRPSDMDKHRARLKIYNIGHPVPLSDILPILENMGLKILSENPYEITPDDVQQPVWIHDFLMELDSHNDIHVAKVKDLFEKALLQIWYDDVENDSLNALVIKGQLPWEHILILRSYTRYLRQAQYPFSQPYIEKTLSDHPDIAQALVNLFMAWHNPENKGKHETLAAGYCVEIDHKLEDVEQLDQDRILRSFLTLIQSTTRTNFFQKDSKGQRKSYLSIKLNSKAIPDLPDPKPAMEIFVYSPRVEAVHLRGGKIARGGIRWSDRHEDFRTEILGLMKAQMVKNAVIVPVGAKGGFVVKHPPEDGGREAFLAEGIECYKTMIRGMLDITDNQVEGKLVPPDNVVRWDEDDPYLVVAADKGTATFSDIANGLSEDYNFWLGDAFASGGSAGYDHKKMGITARGAWESVKRHFRELNKNIQEEPFDAIGVGDMGGDVFGNGMLLSKHIKLIGAFNHLHIFCDPDPNIEKGYKERQRLFKAVKGWDHYNEKLLSKGGRIYKRSDKSLKLTPEIKERFGLASETVSPNELIRAMLTCKTDLLWFGGIGTYLKSMQESHADVGDKTNDMLRVNAKDVKTRVIGEGANLGVTQLGRIEYAQRGGKINADFIDNSGGVDSSDHEVNIKILTRVLIEDKKHKMTVKKRDTLLEKMTDEVAALVLKNNYRQSQALSLMEIQSIDQLSVHKRFIRDLERDHDLNRVLEGLPDEDTIQGRLRDGQGLTRPELAVLLAYAKITFFNDIWDSDIPDDPQVKEWIVHYFPKPLRKKYETTIMDHRLKREIIATTISNSLVNRLGATFMKTMMQKTGASIADITRAYLVVREAFNLRVAWRGIEALDNKIPADFQLETLLEGVRLVERTVAWFVSKLPQPLNITKEIKHYQKGVQNLMKCLDDVLPQDLLSSINKRQSDIVKRGLSEDLAHTISIQPILGSALDIIRTGIETGFDIEMTAKTYFALGDKLSLHWLRETAYNIAADDHWEQQALNTVIDNLYQSQASLTATVLTELNEGMACDMQKTDLVKCWCESHHNKVSQLNAMIQEIKRAPNIDLAMLSIVEQRFRNLADN